MVSVMKNPGREPGSVYLVSYRLKPQGHAPAPCLWRRDDLQTNSPAPRQSKRPASLFL